MKIMQGKKNAVGRAANRKVQSLATGGDRLKFVHRRSTPFLKWGGVWLGN